MSRRPIPALRGRWPRRSPGRAIMARCSTYVADLGDQGGGEPLGVEALADGDGSGQGRRRTRRSCSSAAGRTANRRRKAQAPAWRRWRWTRILWSPNSGRFPTSRSVSPTARVARSEDDLIAYLQARYDPKTDPDCARASADGEERHGGDDGGAAILASEPGGDMQDRRLRRRRRIEARLDDMAGRPARQAGDRHHPDRHQRAGCGRHHAPPLGGDGLFLAGAGRLCQPQADPGRDRQAADDDRQRHRGPAELSRTAADEDSEIHHQRGGRRILPARQHAVLLSPAAAVEAAADAAQLQALDRRHRHQREHDGLV